MTDLREKYKAFTNYLHNDLEISKEDIRGWIQESVAEQVRSVVRSPEFVSAINKMAWDVLLSRHGKVRSMMDEIVESTVSNLNRRLVLSVKPEKDSAEGV